MVMMLSLIIVSFTTVNKAKDYLVMVSFQVKIIHIQTVHELLN